MSKLSNLALRAAAAALVLGLSGSADAAFYTFPGSRCVAGTQSSAYYTDNLIVASGGTSVYCPLLRRAPDAQAITGLGVSVNDGTSQQGVECMVRSCNANGIGCSNSSIVSTSAAFTGISTLSLGSVSGFTNGLVFLTCSLPSPGTANGQGGSYIAGYKWND